MNKKINIYISILIIVSVITLIFSFGGNYVYEFFSFDNVYLVNTLIFFKSIGKLTFDTVILKKDTINIYESEFLNGILVNICSLIISFIVLIGCVQFIKSNGIIGLKAIKFGLIIISCNCLIDVYYCLYNLVVIIFIANYTRAPGSNLLEIAWLIGSICLFIYCIYFNKTLQKLEKKNILKNLTNESSIFNDVSEIRTYKNAARGCRFLNCLIDFIIVLVVSLNISLWGYDGEEIANSFGFKEFSLFAFVLLVFFVLFVFYYTFFEKVFGYTAGKALTNTKVINEAGNNISIGQAFGRTFNRFVPLEWVSAFTGKMWHDERTNTCVVNVHTPQAQHKVNDVGVLY